jgi:hypothetical protein
MAITTMKSLKPNHPPSSFQKPLPFIAIKLPKTEIHFEKKKKKKRKAAAADKPSHTSPQGRRRRLRRSATSSPSPASLSSASAASKPRLCSSLLPADPSQPLRRRASPPLPAPHLCRQFPPCRHQLSWVSSLCNTKKIERNRREGMVQKKKKKAEEDERKETEK